MLISQQQAKTQFNAYTYVFFNKTKITISNI